MRRGLAFMALLAMLAMLAGPLAARELASFSCERPQPWEPGAVTNVSVAAALIDGRELLPGQEFSFNAAMDGGLGRFVDATSYAAGRVVSSDGGGICQVSSCLYNAVVLAGLEVLERANHSLYDPAAAYVPAGRDAMVSRAGHSDFRFRNSTAAPLRLRAQAQGGKVTVALMGRQRHPRQRWVETQLLQRLPKAVQEVPSPGLAAGQRRQLRPGFDGLVVVSRVCWLDAQGVTRSASLGRDAYRKVDERWAVAAAPGGEP
jgi:vancomycin resistance protein YoaR